MVSETRNGKLVLVSRTSFLVAKLLLLEINMSTPPIHA